MTLIHNPDTHRLGKLAAKPPRLRIADYIDLERALPDAPATVDNSKGGSVPLAMYGNDRAGDCTCAAVGNLLRVNSRGAKQITDADVMTAYEAVTAQENNGQGYDPATGANDNGCAELDVLDYWTTTGVGGDKLLGHAGVDMTRRDEHRVVAWLFGAVYLGVALATQQQSQQVWDYVPGSQPGSWGGHAVPEFDVNVNLLGQTGAIIIGTWGAYKAATPAFLAHQADEGHAVVTQSWLDANQDNPLVSAQALADDLADLGAES